jgi:DNA-binding transcriptional ArsR family regulator
MLGKWKKAVWEAVQRRAREGVVSRADLIEYELDQIIREVGSVGKTPHQTLSRELQELRDSGVLIFDGDGNYRIASDLEGMDVEEAVVTEFWRYQKVRRGQGRFREELAKYWHATCPLTGINEPELLRASHIIPWNRCEKEEDRTDPGNGILLSALWDSAFDRGLVTFGDDGAVLASKRLSEATLSLMSGRRSDRIVDFNATHKENLKWHRRNQWVDVRDVDLEQ